MKTRKSQPMDFLGRKYFIAAVMIVIAVSIGYGFFLSGAPSSVRLQKLDERRVRDLHDLANAIFDYVNAQGYGRLPPHLSDLNDTTSINGGTLSFQDPETGRPYDYFITSSENYQLCAVFDTEVSSTVPASAHSAIQLPESKFWNHPKGKDCFTLTVTHP